MDPDDFASGGGTSEGEEISTILASATIAVPPFTMVKPAAVDNNGNSLPRVRGIVSRKRGSSGVTGVSVGEIRIFIVPKPMKPQQPREKTVICKITT